MSLDVGRMHDAARDMPFRESPSLFFFASSAAAFRAAAWTGVALSAAAFLGAGNRLHPIAPAAIWFALWLLYLSFVNVGQLFYGFGYFKTQPMPNPLTWYFHWMPSSVHRAGVVFNHVHAVPRRSRRIICGSTG